MEVGFQDPVIPLLDVTGNWGGVDPWQSGPTFVNTGRTVALTVMLMLVVVLHSPAEGVKA